jgi:L-lysine 6-transaminase
LRRSQTRCAARFVHCVDLPDPKIRDKFWKGLFDGGVLALKSGEQAIRFRPALDIDAKAIDEAMDLLRKQCQRMQR